MNEETNGEYMLLFRGTDWSKGLSPEQCEKTMTQFKNWFDGLMASGKVKGGHPLENAGKVVSGKNGRVVADGPFAESKEAIGGYFMLSVSGLDEAVAIAKACPALEHGGIVEVRPIAAVCSMAAKLEAARELATA